MGAVNSALAIPTDIHRLLRTGNKALFAVKCASYCSAVSSVASAARGVYHIIDGVNAQNHLVKLGGEISKDVKAMAESTDVIAAHLDQSAFAKHVYDFALMHIEQQSVLSGSMREDYFFIFHPGTDWYPSFYALNKASPLPGLCGIENDIGGLADFLSSFRDIVGRAPTIHILVPAAHMIAVPEPLEIPEKLYPLQIKGTLHRSHKPYVYLTVRNAPCNLGKDIGLVDAGPERVLGKRRQAVLSNSAAAGAGTAAGVGVAWVAGVVGFVVFPPLALGGVALGAWVGTKAALAAKESVEESVPVESAAKFLPVLDHIP